MAGRHPTAAVDVAADKSCEHGQLSGTLLARLNYIKRVDEDRHSQKLNHSDEQPEGHLFFLMETRGTWDSWMGVINPYRVLIST